MKTTISFAWVYEWLLASGYLLFGQLPAHMLEESATGFKALLQPYEVPQNPPKKHQSRLDNQRTCLPNTSSMENLPGIS